MQGSDRLLAHPQCAQVAEGLAMNSDRDPLERMPQFLDPEPDPAVMRATIAQSREAFANRRPSPQANANSVAHWFRQPVRWLIPVGVAVAALVVALLFAPGLLTT